MRCGSAFAAWEQNGICIADSGEEVDVMFIAPDPACGASVLWQSNSHIDGSCGIGVTKFDWNGLDQWEGSVSCPTYRCVGAYDLISDGGMGVFALTGGSNYYEPDPFSSVCINRISGDGAVSETAIATFDYYTTDRARLIPDGQSGAIAVWEDHRSGISLYAQKLDFAGLPAWPAGGVQVDSNHENGLHTEIISDGGAVMAWTDYRNSVKGDNRDLRCRRQEDQKAAGSHDRSGRPHGKPGRERRSGQADVVGRLLLPVRRRREMPYAEDDNAALSSSFTERSRTGSDDRVGSSYFRASDSLASKSL